MFGISFTPSAKLEVGITIDKIRNSSASEDVKAKQIELFNKYNTTPDDKIDEREFAAYEKDFTKQKWKVGLMIAGGIALAGLTAFALWKGYKHFKSLNEAVFTVKDPVQEVRTQAYYDEILEDILQSGGKKNYFNPRTGNTTTVEFYMDSSRKMPGVPLRDVPTVFPDHVTVSNKDGYELSRLVRGHNEECLQRYTRNFAYGDNGLNGAISNIDHWSASDGCWYTVNKSGELVKAPESRIPISL